MRLKFLIFFVFIPQILWSQQIIEKEITDWEFRMVGDSIWKPAKVPGTIIDNFVDLSDISNPLHPYYGDNEKLYQWIAENDWQFYANIPLDSTFMRKGYSPSLHFEQLDLYSVVFIDGLNYFVWIEDVLHKKNTLLPNSFVSQNFRLDVAYHFEPNKFNIEVIVELTSIMKKLRDEFSNAERLYSTNDLIFARKPAYEFGWDWAPKFVNMGIRKPVKLVLTPPLRTTISTPKFAIINYGRKKKLLSCKVNISTPYDTVDLFVAKYKNGKVISTVWISEISDGSTVGDAIFNPELWWPNGMTDSSAYYEFDFKVKKHGDTVVLDKKHVYYAVCDIKLIQEKDKIGESFYFKVNGKKVYAKGANYVPDDSFHPGKNTKELIRLAREANMNMLRVWGGGTYPDDDFYIECMKNRIMVWQDFMFACNMYPGSLDFLSNISIEAREQVNRLKEFNHIALWCGNNEIEEGWKNWGWQKQMEMHGEDSIAVWKDYDNVFNHVLPDIINDINTTDHLQLNYISTSPKHGWGRKESMTEGDSHYWGVWWGLEPLGKYEEKVPRFMSEFGMQGMPDLSTLKKVIPDSAMNFDSPKFKNHQKHPTGFETLNHYLKEYLVIPTNMEDYAYATQILQSYALTIAIEAQRRAMPYCMGSLIWQLNDCWPVTSWSLIDSELKNKIAYWEVKKSFEPVHISIEEANKEILIKLIKDQGGTVKGKLELEINNFYGKNLWSAKKITSVSNRKVITIYKIKKSNLREFDLNEIYLKATFNYGEKTAETFYHFVKPKQLTLPQAQFIVEDEGDYNSITVTSNVYAPFTKYESFYFGHLEPGKPKKFWIYNIADADAILFNPKKVRCLNQLLN